MNFVFFISVITSLALVLSARGYEIRGRIFGGQNVESGHFKYMALVRSLYPVSEKGTCAGSIIGPHWVLTAGHCLHNVEKASIVLGAIDITDADIYYEVEQHNIKMHPEFNLSPIRHDIALMRIPQTEACDKIAFAQMPFRWRDHPLNTFIGMTVVAAGWGYTGNIGPLAKRLQWTRMAIISNDECNRTFKDIIHRDICATTKKPYGSTCMGDSGAPLVLEKTDEVIGIISAIPFENCEGGGPVISVRISDYLSWITDQTGIH